MIANWAGGTLLAAACASGFAQTPTFTTQSPLVVVPVTVSAKNGEPILGLTQATFQLLDNGQERKINVEPWGAYESHVALAVVIQTSALSDAALLKVKKTAGMLDSITGERGEIAVITADGEVQTRVNFTSRWEPVQETFEKLKARGGEGRVLDGVDAAITLLAQRPAGERRLVLVLSEARDRGSKAQASDVLTRAQQQNVTIYTATYSAYATPFTAKASELQPPEGGGLLLLFSGIAHAAKQNIGETLAEYTGGRHLGFATLHRLEEDLAEIGKQVHSQYLLSFVPATEKNPVYHQLTVTVKEHEGVLIRARPGYWNGMNVSDQAK